MKFVNKTNNYAFIVLKPDAVKQFLDINIIQELSKEQLEVIKQKMVLMTREQVAAVYAEKIGENYYALLEKFLMENHSICLLLKSTKNAIKESQRFKDKIRESFKICKFKISEKDIELLKTGQHPQQEEITREMALENLIHAANNFREVCECINSIFTESEIQEIREKEPELYELFLEYRREIEKPKELTFNKR